MHERIKAAARELIRTRMTIDAINPQRIPIEYRTKDRWSREIQAVAMALEVLADELAGADADRT